MRLIILSFLLTSLISWAEIQSAKFAATELGNRWWQHDQFGIFYDAGNSWYYHIDHGWIYVDQWRDNGTWLFMPLKDKFESKESNSSINEQVALGWMWSKAEHYPRLYNNELEDWMYFNKDRNESKYYCYSLKKYLWEDFILKINTPPEIWKSLETLFFIEDYEALETDFIPDIDLAYAVYFNVTIPKEELALDNKWSSLIQSIQKDEIVRKKIRIRKIEEDEANYFIKFHPGRVLPVSSSNASTVLDSKITLREYNPKIPISEVANPVQIRDISDERYLTVQNALVKFSEKKTKEIIPVALPWESNYIRWVQNPEPYGGLEVLQKIKEAKDSGATHLNLTWDGDGNKITDISPLAELTTLVNLHIVGHNVSELKPLAGLTNLKSLSLNVNEISDISPLAGLTNLTTLEIPRNRITDVTPLADLIKLSSLFIYSNNISDITQLSGLTKMFHLRIDHNNISDISSLMGMSNLMTIDIRSNPISDSQKDILRNAFPYANIDL